jgi:hypothetical protein
MRQAQTPFPIIILPSALPTAAYYLQRTLIKQQGKQAVPVNLVPPAKIFFLYNPLLPFVLHLVNQSDKFTRSLNPLNPEPPETTSKGFA